MEQLTVSPVVCVLEVPSMPGEWPSCQMVVYQQLYDLCYRKFKNTSYLYTSVRGFIKKLETGIFPFYWGNFAPATFDKFQQVLP